MQDIQPLQNTNNIRLADFVRVTTVNAGIETVSLFSTAPYAITVPAIDPNPFIGLSSLVQIGEVQRDIKSTANETSVTLVGIDTALLGFVLGQNIKGSKIEMWHGFFDTNNNLINNLALYSQRFDNAVWDGALNGITSRIPNSAIAPDGTNTATKLVFSGASDPYIGQIINAGEPIAGKTFTFSIWAWTDLGQPTSLNELYIYDSTVTFISQKTITLTTTPTRYELTYTFPLGVTGNNFTIRFDGQNSPPPPASSYCYLWGAQAEKNISATNYVATTTSQQSGLYKFFTGYINSFSISEQWMEELRMFVGTINVSASSIQIILQNRTAGRYTNNNAWQFFNAGDTSMARVNFIQSINYFFGKSADPSVYKT